MTYTVYVLYSTKDKKLYVGCTSDIEKRVERHYKGLVPATKHRRPIVLIHTEAFREKEKAFVRERFLKSLWGAKEKRTLLKKYLHTAKPRPWGRGRPTSLLARFKGMLGFDDEPFLLCARRGVSSLVKLLTKHKNCQEQFFGKESFISLCPSLRPRIEIP